jgi:DNA replication initiation complex subunit (GINS family)
MTTKPSERTLTQFLRNLLNEKEQKISPELAIDLGKKTEKKSPKKKPKKPKSIVKGKNKFGQEFTQVLPGSNDRRASYLRLPAQMMR